MFYEVRIYKANGKLKEKISSTELSGQHWDKFEKIEEGIGLNTTALKPVPAWVKAKLDLEFPSNLESDYQNAQGLNGK